MSVWSDFGFRNNPYSVEPLSADRVGASLLTGRDEDVRQLVERIRSLDTHPTIEGDSGTGKTSLIGAASFVAWDEWSTGVSAHAIIPVGRSFQLTPNRRGNAFEQSVLFALANAVIENKDDLQHAGYETPDTALIEQWLSLPVIRSYQVGVGGVSAGRATSANTGAGFEAAGFENMVMTWLKKCFPTRASGGFLCVVDNLELLETSSEARSQIEGLRDTSFSLPGVIWVFSGANGIARTCASSPRLQGRLSDPLELGPLSRLELPVLIQRRLDHFRMSSDAYVPVEAAHFATLVGTMNGNLRDSFKLCQDYALEMASSTWPESAEEKGQAISDFLDDLASRYDSDTSGVSKTAWDAFDQLVELGGFCSPSDFSHFGFKSADALRKHTKSLENAQLVVTQFDKDDSRRRRVSVTSRGWIVARSRGIGPQ